jgi:Flp pilus assembly protein TadB
VQSQTGGNLAEVLARLATLMRQRCTLQLKVKALSAEGRLSAWFLTAMPFILYGAIRLLSNDYLASWLAVRSLCLPWPTGSSLAIARRPLLDHYIHPAFE